MSNQEFIDYLGKRGLEPCHASDIKAGADSALIAVKRDGNATKKVYVSLSEDCTFGRYYDCKTGDSDFWVAKNDGRIDRTEHKRQSDALRREHERKRALEQKQAADIAKEQWALSDSPSPAHLYLQRKMIQPYGIAQEGKALLVPMRHTIKGEIIGLQSIYEDGSKYFGKNVAKKGAFCLITPSGDELGAQGAGGPTAFLYIMEGYATGATLFDATGCLTAVAFDRGNLKPVAEYFRGLYPEATIIIAGDNDKSGDGQKSAQQAALGCAGHVLLPPDEGMDWNDHYIEYGIDDTIGRFEAFQADIQNRLADADSFPRAPKASGEEPIPVGDSQSPPAGSLIIDTLEADATIPASVPDWATGLKAKGFDKNGNIIIDGKSLHNAMVLVQNLKELKDVFRYNEFKSDVFVCKCPPWRDDRAFKAGVLEELDIIRCEAYLEVSDGMSVGKQKIWASIKNAADKNRFHPVREYFDALEWDGVPRLDGWLARYARVRAEPEEYVSFVGKTWLIAGAARVYEPGCKFDHMLVLEGPQDAGKSLLLRTIGTFGRDIEESYYTDAITIDKVEDRASIMMLQGRLIVEFPELSGMGKKDQNQIKRWITLQSDEVEVKYEQRTQFLPRQFILAGTYNPEAGEGWLNDSTGGRRFWPVTTGLDINIAGLKEVREQLWAEAVHHYKQGYDLYIKKTDPVYKLAKEEQEKRSSSDVWTSTIAKKIERGAFFETHEILGMLDIPIGKQGQQEKKRVSKIMAQLGWSLQQRRFGNSRTRGWCKLDKQPELEPEEVEGW